LYTSPHLVRVEERIRLRGRDISRDDLARHLDSVRGAITSGLSRGTLGAHPSFFEVMTAAALLAFREARIDLAILEVGLGGRLDATNVVDPIVSVIVSIDFDHTDRLGTTIEAIAAEKAGIIRADRPLVSGVGRGAARAVLHDACARVGARWVDALEEARLDSGLRLALPGEHQIENARVAVVAANVVSSELGISLPAEAVRRGLIEVRWPGRLQWIDGDPPLLLDGAHNRAGADVLAAFLRAREGPAPVLLFAATQGKDVPAILAPLREVVSEVVLTRSRVERSADPTELAAVVRDAFERVDLVPDASEALQRARDRAKGRTFVLVAGSLYLVGEVLSILEGGSGPGPVSM
jgi:dihydrofolate synthase/folylpolyglutamate synthase